MREGSLRRAVTSADYKDRDRDQTFTYDWLNRLSSAQNAGTDCSQATVNIPAKTQYWGNSYTYDAWGNVLQKTVTKCGAENLQVTADAHNWIHGTSVGSPDYQYDAAGNMTYDATGEWAKERMVATQFQNVKSNDIDQFKDIVTQVIVAPAAFKTGDMIYPYADAKK